MGTGVLSASSDTSDLLVFAHCTQLSKTGITLAFVNVNPSLDYHVNIDGISVTPRHLYILSPNGGIKSQSVSLNGVPLVYENGSLSPIPPKIVTDTTVPIVIPPQTYGFIVFPSVKNPCNDEI